jgi:hypothetical protein
MQEPELFELFNQGSDVDNNISRFISPIIEDDSELINSFLLQKENTSDDLQLKFEDSFEYIRMYFNSGNYSGFKFFDDESLIIFAQENKKKPHFKLFKPIGTNAFEKVPGLIDLLSSITSYPIQTICLDKNSLKMLKKIRKIQVKNIKEFNYYIYDLKSLDNLSGNRWKNVRQKITAFHKNYPKLKTEPLAPENCKDAIHFIGAWRSHLLSDRGHSYANVEKNKFAIKYYSNRNDFENVWSRVYRLKGRIVAAQLLYRLNPDSAARTGLEKYKFKFNPVTTQQVFECKLTVFKDK